MLCVVGGGVEVAGHVFISYVREDGGRVDQLQRALEAAGVTVWRDTDSLWPGEDWRAKIRSAITDSALVFIACYSQVSLDREKSYQNEEMVLAIEQLRLRPPGDLWLFPVRFDDCELPDLAIGAGRTLASIRWRSARTATSSPPRAATGQRGSGRWPPALNCCRSSTMARCNVWHSARTGACLPPAAATRLRRSGG